MEKKLIDEVERKRIANLTETEVQQECANWSDEQFKARLFPDGTISFEEFSQEMYKIIEEIYDEK